jgi:hypothetical protein
VDALLVDLISVVSFAVLVAFIWFAGGAIVPSAPSPERLAAGVFVVLGLAWIVMAAGSTGVGMLGSPYPIVTSVVIVAAAWGYRQVPFAVPRPDWVAVTAGAAGGVLISFSAWWAPNSPPVGEMALHLGWIRELTAGAAQPGHPYADVPNSYPWLYHALGGAFDVAALGGLAVAVLLLQAFLVLGLALGSWLTACEVGLTHDEAVWGLVLTLLGGGLAVADSPEPVASLGNVPPPLPRELGLSIFALVLWLLIRTATRRSAVLAAVAGCGAGLAFVAAPIAGLVSLAVAAVLLARRAPRLIIPAVAAATVAILPWALPLARDYRRLHGFRAITPLHAETPSLARLIWAVGLVSVLGILGLLMLSRRSEGGTSLILASAVSSILVLIAAVSGSDWAPLQVPAFGRTVRYVPELALTLSIAAAVPIAAGARRSRGAAVAVGLLCLLLPVISGVRTGIATAERPSFDGHCLRDHGVRAGHTVAVLGTPRHTMAALALFGATGASPLYMPRPRLRFASIYTTIPTVAQRQRWLGRIVRGQPWPDYVTEVLVPFPAAHEMWRGARRVTECGIGGRRYALYRRV